MSMHRSLPLILLAVILLSVCPTPRPAHAAGRDMLDIDPQADWQISVLDSPGDVGYFTAAAVDKNNQVHISYLDNTNHVLKYATNAMGGWTITSVGPANGLNNTAIGVDSTGKVYIAYVNSTAARIAIRDLAGNWTTTSPGFTYALANGISLTIDSNNIVHVAAPTYYRQQYGPDVYQMEYANNSSGSFQKVRNLPTCMSGAITLRSPSAASDASGNVYVAFNVSDNLVYATNKTGTWACNYIQIGGAQPVYYSNRYLAVKSTGQPAVAAITGTEFMALAVDPQDKSHIVGLQNNCLRYFTDASGSQQAEYLDCTSAKVGEYGSIVADALGGMHIAYFDRTNGNLKYATQGTIIQKRPVYLPLLLRQAPPAPLSTATPTATATDVPTTTATPTATATTQISETDTPTATPTATATSMPTTTATPTATATDAPTVTATPTATATTAAGGIYNGDFEITDSQGAVGWTGYSKNGYSVCFVQRAVGTVRPHSGDIGVWLGGSNNEVNYVEQTNVRIPTVAPVLGYWLWFASAETACGNDFGKVLINGAVVAQYDLCSATNTSTWVQRTVDLAAYAGQTVTVQIRAETNGSVNSNLFLDDVNFE
jgi:hypothetical protein